jgi:ribonuclease R
MISEEAVLQNLERQPKHSAAFKTIAHELGVRGEDERRHLHELLADMVARKQLKATREAFVLTDGARARSSSRHARSARDSAVGRLSMHRDGYGFVRPESDEWRKRISGDIYISPRDVGSAMHGDRVVVDVIAVKSDGRADGRIRRVVERQQETVVGVFRRGDRFNFVVPMDAKVAMDIIIPRGAENISTTDDEVRRGSRHRVFGEEAQRRHEHQDLDGMVVNVEITEWPSATSNPKGRIVEVLGYEDDFGVDVEIIIRKHHIPHRFPTDVLEEAQEVEETIPARELRHRRDYRGLPIVTIDGETARDFDDAVFVRRKSNGNFELHVHIADVAQYVRDGMAIDEEARLRGTSVYFPDRAVPMLPIELSTNVCSLRPKVDRLVLSCVMEIDHHGSILNYEINEGVIRSAERMTYTDVNAILEGDMPVRRRYERIVDVFELMRELAMVLNRKRVKRGSIDFDLPEPVIEFDEHGLMKAVVRSERNIAHRLIEEFMLAANETVATYLENKGVPSLYRIHEKPDPKRVFEFETLAASFGYSLGVGALPVKKFRYVDDRRPRRHEGQRGRGGQRERTFEIPEDVHVTPRMYQKLTEKLAGKPEERILSYLMLRSLKQARYSEENVGHFALAAPTYTHFTSPIRRYPDLIVHRILKEVLRDAAEFHDTSTDAKGATHEVPVGRGSVAAVEKKSPWSRDNEAMKSRQTVAHSVSRVKSDDKQAEPHRGDRKDDEAPIPLDELHDIAETSSQSERRADDAERELMDWKKARFMQERVGEEFEGMIVSVTKFGFFVELTELFIEGLVPLNTLAGDKYYFNEDTRQIIGQRSKRTFSLGDTVRVLVDRIDPVEKKINFAIVEEEPTRKDKRRKRSGR